MVEPFHMTVALLLLAVSLAVAVLRPRGLPEAAGAVPATGVALALGLLSRDEAGRQLRELGPTVGFLAAVLVLARLCAQDGLFEALGDRIGSTSRGSPVRLLRLVFVAAAVITAVLSLDTTVVLLTPVVLATATRVRLPSRPATVACVHLSNSASLLLPVSNLTNLLALQASGLSFVRFAGLMTAPWLVALGVEWVVLHRSFRAELRGTGERVPAPRPLPRWSLAVVVMTLAGFVVASLVGLDLWVAATAGAALLAVPALTRGRTTVGEVVRAADVPFLAFVLGLAVVVEAVQVSGLDRLGAHLPHDGSLPTLLLLTVVAAVLANLVNNLPAVLVLLPATAGHPAAVLAVLIGVDVGPNLTYVGSLATLLWRRLLDEPVSLREFTRLGLLTVPAQLVLCPVALWLALRAG